jgi:RPA family protein
MDKPIKRHTAYKVWIRDVHKSPEKIDEDSGLPYLDINDKHVSRVHLFGSIINTRATEGYGSLILDDGSANIQLKTWGADVYLAEDKQVGDLVFVVGRYSTFNNERYIRPEVVRRVSMDWALLRRLELTKEYGIPSKEEKVEVAPDNPPQTETGSSLSLREAILNEIEKQDEVEEEALITVCNMPKEEVMLAVQDLLKEGEIFCPKKGYYRLV